MSNLVMLILGATLQESLDIGIELGLKLLAQLIKKLIHGLWEDDVGSLKRLVLLPFSPTPPLAAISLVDWFLICFFFPSRVAKEFVHIGGCPNHTPAGDSMHKRLQTTYNVARM